MKPCFKLLPWFIFALSLNLASYGQGPWIYQRYTVSVEFLTFTERNVTDPVLQKSIMPAYPNALMIEGITGDTIVQFNVSPKGEVVDLVILQASSKGFGKEAETAVKQWSFQPSMDLVTHSTVAAKMRCRFAFNMEEPAYSETEKLKNAPNESKKTVRPDVRPTDSK